MPSPLGICAWTEEGLVRRLATCLGPQHLEGRIPMTNAGVIGQFNDSYAPIPDGVARVVCEYARWLHEAKTPTCVITTSAPGYHDTEPFPVHRYLSVPTVVRPPYRFGMPWLDFTFWRRMRAIDFRLVHAHCPF